MSYCITLADTQVLVVDPERLDRLLPEMDKMKSTGLKRIVLIRSEGSIEKYKGLGVDVVTMEELEAGMESEYRGKECPLPDVDPDPDTDATILFTSGTTGWLFTGLDQSRGACGLNSVSCDQQDSPRAPWERTATTAPT